MKAFRKLVGLAGIALLGVVEGQNFDLFNYGSSDKNENGMTSRGQPNWDQVRCGNDEICTGFPNKFPAVQQNFSWYQWEIDSMGNNCKWCPEDSSNRNCGVHRQSPIDMRRYVGEDTHPLHKECKDWHWMQYKDDTCTFDAMKNSFEINRHALQLWIPVRDDGKIDCWEKGKGRRYPRLDYSKGFPDWWWLQRTDVSLPSQHTQEGFRYAAEVTLAHFYQIGHAKNELGYVTLFMQDYDDEPSWPFLDKLICQWREKEEQLRASCGEPPAPPYGRCRIYSERGQVPTQEWLVEAGLITPTEMPTAKPTVAPTKKPTASPTANPTVSPSAGPTARPTPIPTTFPTASPTANPTTASPIASPTFSPSAVPRVRQPASDSADEFEQDGEEGGRRPNPSPAKAPSRFRPSSFTPDSVTDPPTNMPSISPTASPTKYPTHSPTESPTIYPTDSPTREPSVSPTKEPTTLPTKEPTAPPTDGPTASVTSSWFEINSVDLPPEIDCPNYSVPGGYNRMCFSSKPCCEATRGGTNYCWNVYDNVFPGPAIESACYHCCEGKLIGPEKPPHPEGYAKTIQCSAYNSQRYCKFNSCCMNGWDSTPYCTREFEKFTPEEWEQLCWYCCEDSINIESGLEGRRELLERDFEEDVIKFAESNFVRSKDVRRKNIAEQHLKKQSLHQTPGEADDTVVMFAEGRMFRLHKEDFEPAEEDPEEYFHQIYDDYKRRHRRAQQVIHEEDYEDVHYWPYEWMLHVGTEYYYRYEGTQTVPPCREFVHWRVMKDPMRVHPRQIAELNRLLAWRLNPSTCRKETAGILSPDGDSVNVSRDIQYRHKGHRDTFCECKDWPSKFENDKEWCRNWEEDVNFDRFYLEPYSFDTDGEWLPP